MTMHYHKYRKITSNQRLLSGANISQRAELQEFVKSNTVIISYRVNGRMTSLKIRSCILAMYCLIMGQGAKTEEDYKGFVLDAIYKICSEWYGEDGKGLSAYVQDRLIRDCLDRDEKSELDFIIGVLENQFGLDTPSVEVG